MRRNVIAQASEFSQDLAPLQGHPNPVDRVQSLCAIGLRNTANAGFE
jgi:hypothetical protein